MPQVPAPVPNLSERLRSLVEYGKGAVSPRWILSLNGKSQAKAGSCTRRRQGSPIH
jgi:hypothetical protein